MDEVLKIGDKTWSLVECKPIKIFGKTIQRTFLLTDGENSKTADYKLIHVKNYNELMVYDD